MTTSFKHFLLAFLILPSTLLFGQDSTHTHTHFYTGLYNEVPENFNYPVIGAVNICNGNQSNVQIGFSNINHKNLSGVQVGFTNAIGAKGNGAQVGFANICKDSLDGAQIGFVNIVANTTDGAQVGFINLSRDYLNGVQVGYVNVAATAADDAQVGFINACKDSLNGMQVGFVNVSGRQATGAQIGYVNIAADDITGVQVGFVNVGTRHVKGVQIGFINVADSLSDGIPYGFISFVRKGGFKAIEAGYSGMYPLNLAFKTGVDAFYTTIIGSYNPDFKNRFALGAGIGSNISLGKHFFFNPEALSQFTFQKHPQQVVSLNTLIGFTFAKRLSVIAGPYLAWVHSPRSGSEIVYEPTSSLYHEKFDARNSLHISAKAAFRVRF